MDGELWPADESDLLTWESVSSKVLDLGDVSRETAFRKNVTWKAHLLLHESCALLVRRTIR